MTQQNYFLAIIEKIIRSNLYLFIFFRYIANKYFSKYIFETEFKILNILKKKNYFADKKKIIIDIGANDGISYKSIRNFIKLTPIISFEPQKQKYKELITFKKNDANYKVYNFGLSYKKNTSNLYVPYFKKYSLSPFAGVNKDFVISRIKQSLFVKNIIKKLIIKSNKIKLDKLDKYKLNPAFIKIDIEGHEYECILGAINTIKTNKPILLVEYNSELNNKILRILKNFNYKAYYYDNRVNKLKLHNGKKVFNIFYIDKNKANIIQNNYDFN